MIRILLLMAFLLGSSLLKAGPQLNQSIRIATYNLWNPVYEKKYAGSDTWDRRLPHIVKNILSAEADVISFQEVNSDCFKQIKSNADIHSRYIPFYFPHAKKEGEKPESKDGLALLLKIGKLSLANLYTSKENSRPSHRKDFYVDLVTQESDDRVKIRVASTHIDASHQLEIGNEQLSRLAHDVLSSAKKDHVDFSVVCGDFNEGEAEAERPRARVMEENGFISDGSTDSTRSEALKVRHKGHVDWIYFKNISKRKFELIPHTPIGDEKASDHKLLMTTLKT